MSKLTVDDGFLKVEDSFCQEMMSGEKMLKLEDA